MHLLRAHQQWKEILKPEDTVIDATCGNGHDTAVLADLVPDGVVLAIDIQEDAIQRTKERLQGRGNIRYFKQCHAHFPEEVQEHSVGLIVYNLGYLPGGDKTLTTQVETTLESLRAAQELLRPGGALSVMLYPGHPEGALEKGTILKWVETLDRENYDVQHSASLNRPLAPSLLMIRHADDMLVAEDEVIDAI